MAYPVTINGRTYTLADFQGLNYVDGFPDALEDFVTDAGAKVTAAGNAQTAAEAAQSAAETAETGAQNAQTAAEAAQAAAEAAQEAIDGLYLGAQATDPTVDLNGDPLTTGDWYFNTVSDSIRVYNGSVFVEITSLTFALVDDTTPQLGGNLDLNSSDITGTGNLNITGNATAVDITGSGNLSITGDATIDGSATSDHFILGNVTTTATSKTLTAGEVCFVTAATQTITLPASPGAGDTVKVGVGNFTDTVIGRNGEPIMSTAEDLTIDSANLTLTLTYVDATIGWRVY